MVSNPKIELGFTGAHEAGARSGKYTGQNSGRLRKGSASQLRPRTVIGIFKLCVVGIGVGAHQVQALVLSLWSTVVSKASAKISHTLQSFVLVHVLNEYDIPCISF